MGVIMKTISIEQMIEALKKLKTEIGSGEVKIFFMEPMGGHKLPLSEESFKIVGGEIELWPDD